MQVRILGCGSSGGVPRIGNDWGVCDPQNRKNRRLRCSILLERFGSGPRPTRVLIDTEALRLAIGKYKGDRGMARLIDQIDRLAERRGAVLRALLPIALGHALSIGVVPAEKDLPKTRVMLPPRTVTCVPG